MHMNLCCPGPSRAFFHCKLHQKHLNTQSNEYFLKAGYHIGINTIGESLKNASYYIRGTIPNPKFVVSPWGNSTYEPDFNLKPLC